MTNVMSFEDRGRAFENQFAMNEEIAFKIKAKTTSLVAQWAADRIGLDEHQSAKYIIEINELVLIGKGESLVKEKLIADFSANNVDISEHALEKLFFLKAEQAKRQLFKEITKH